MQAMLQWLSALVFPPRCAVCTEVLPFGRRKETLCADCAAGIPYLTAAVCPHCGGKAETAGFCADCLKGYAFDSACAAFPYAKVRQAIHRLKYDGGMVLGDGLGALMADYLTVYHPRLLQADVILGVPLHPKRQKQRGFNQTHLLCREIAARTGLPFQAEGLTRRRNTVAQNALSAAERKRNLQGAILATADFSGKKVLLIDDIFTTGSTCNECAKALFRAGAAEVHIFCLSAAGSGQRTAEEKPWNRLFCAKEAARRTGALFSL